ncbi:MAG: Transcriptional regulator, AbiEi antitoxin, partial [Solirubrobacteraceae bacterium]|nr:Transcriptional regulator, AbiEi antitoxin [Solirubrobacteraceae bacterium]
MAAWRGKCLPPALLKTAETQDDLLRFAQLYEAGFSHSAVSRMTDAGILQGVHRGVYKVLTATPSADGRRRAAVYAS